MLRTVCHYLHITPTEDIDCNLQHSGKFQLRVSGTIFRGDRDQSQLNQLLENTYFLCSSPIS